MSFSPSYSISSAPGGRRSAAARRSRELWEPERRLPEIPRTFICLLLGELELDDELDVVREREAALRQRRVPSQAVLGAIDDRLELDAELREVAEGDDRLGDRALSLDRARVALDRELAVDEQPTVVDAHERRGETDLRVVGDVEEVGRGQVRGEVLVLHVDR